MSKCELDGLGLLYCRWGERRERGVIYLAGRKIELCMQFLFIQSSGYMGVCVCRDHSPKIEEILEVQGPTILASNSFCVPLITDGSSAARVEVALSYVYYICMFQNFRGHVFYSLLSNLFQVSNKVAQSWISGLFVSL
ncbi:hypothetical protein KP509_31G028200 [Ceratopteris richardii]|uniref:Uncharacterized protein n=1 Tax=Ceratopteris richardii TaxID=49495 RepID=A0A8T2QY20_CERRI|nr:hypothetical protein KP509_31G028200 [Ceratopteris richardii]